MAKEKVSVTVDAAVLAFANADAKAASLSRGESQRWSRHVPKRRSTLRMPEA
jgi:hypothetical protein